VNIQNMLLDAILGPPESHGVYVGKRCYDKLGAESGAITKVSRCRLTGCTGARLHVKWPDGRRTYPCTKGCRLRDDGDYQIE
jgi:hypothetical protein